MTSPPLSGLFLNDGYKVNKFLAYQGGHPGIKTETGKPILFLFFSSFLWLTLFVLFMHGLLLFIKENLFIYLFILIHCGDQVVI